MEGTIDVNACVCMPPLKNEECDHYGLATSASGAQVGSIHATTPRKVFSRSRFHSMVCSIDLSLSIPHGPCLQITGQLQVRMQALKDGSAELITVIHRCHYIRAVRADSP